MSLELNYIYLVCILILQHFLKDNAELLEDGRQVKCKICGEILAHRQRFRIHLREKHAEALGMTTWSCDQCPDKIYSRKLELEYHILEVHKKTGKYCCDICGYVTMRHSSFLTHMGHHDQSEEKGFVCELCAASFKVKNGLWQHMRKVHGGQKKVKGEYPCKYCPEGGGVSFDNKSLLDRHFKAVHEDLYVHRCSKCQNVYMSAASLQLHLKINHGNNKVECQFCGVVIKNRVCLYGHYNTGACSKMPTGFKYSYPRC